MTIDNVATSLTNQDIQLLLKSFKDENFIKHLKNFAEEIKDPKNFSQFEKEVKLYEKQRGVDVQFLTPLPGLSFYCEHDGKLAFINVCVCDKIEKSVLNPVDKNESKGIQWHLPHVILPLRQEFDINEVKKSLQATVKKDCFDELSNGINKDGLWIYDFVANPVCISISSESDYLTSNLIDIVQETIQNKLKENVKNIKLVAKDYYVGTPRVFQLKTIVDQKTYVANQADNSILQNTTYQTPKYQIKYVNHSTLQDYSIANKDETPSQPKFLRLTIDLPEVSAVSFIDAKAIGNKFHLETNCESKYKLDIELPYIVEENPIEAKFDVDKEVLNLKLAVKTCKKEEILDKNGNEAISKLSTDSGIECGTENNDASTICIPEDDVFESSNETNNNSTKLVNRFLTPNCAFSQEKDKIFISISFANINKDSIEIHKVNSSEFYFKCQSLGKSFTPILIGGYVSIKNKSFKNVSLKEVLEKEVQIEILKDSNESWTSIYYGSDQSSTTEHSIKEIPVPVPEIKEIESLDEALQNLTMTNRTKLVKSASIPVDIYPGCRVRRKSYSFDTGSFPKGILKTRSRCSSESHDNGNFPSSLDSGCKMEEIDEYGDAFDSGTEISVSPKKIVHFNNYVDKKFFPCDLKKAIIMKKCKETKKKQSKKKKNSSSEKSSSEDDSSTFEIEFFFPSFEDHETNSSYYERKNKTKKEKKKAKKKKRKMENFANEMMFHMEDDF